MIKSRVPRSLKTRDAQRKSQYAGKNKSAMVNKFCVGQNVLLAKHAGNKMSSVFENKLYKIIRQKGSNLLVKSENGQTFYRNVSHVWPYYGLFLDVRTTTNTMQMCTFVIIEKGNCRRDSVTIVSAVPSD